MASTSSTRAAAPPKAGGGGAHKQVMGLPAWMWIAGGGVLIVGYLYMRSHASSSTTGQGTGKGTGTGRIIAVSPAGLSTEQLLLLLQDWQASHGGKGGKGHGRHGGGGGGGGPERKWLIQKTGSQHPWTFLAQHHERIVIGPHGSRTIVGSGGGGKKGGH